MNVRGVTARAVALGALAFGLQGVADANVAVELRPDLQVGRLSGMRIRPTPNGHVRLHFGTIGWNVGAGPLEARGNRIDPNDFVMKVRQRIFRSDGTHRDRVTSAVMIYETGDHHDHWHTSRFMTVELYQRGAPGGDVYGIRKLGYCLLDAARMANPPPESPDTRGYPNGSCGNRGSRRVRSGLSVGYGDDYPADYAHQWIDVTGLRTGTYRICTSIDPLQDFVEESESNNQRWTDVRINRQARTVRVLATAIGRCGPNV
jgi:hypothetical protein